MQAKDVIRQSIDITDMIFSKYLEDLDDSAFMRRPVAGMNHIAWQVGHLLESEHRILDAIKPGCCPPLPEGFSEAHNRETTGSDDPKGFHTKAEYLGLWKSQRDAIKTLLDSMTDADLDAPGPERMRQMCPTVGSALQMMTALHPMMHAGQFVAVRRALGKPIAM